MDKTTRIIILIGDIVFIVLFIALLSINGFDPVYILGLVCGIISFVLSVYMMINEGNGD